MVARLLSGVVRPVLSLIVKSRKAKLPVAVEFNSNRRKQHGSSPTDRSILFVDCPDTLWGRLFVARQSRAGHPLAWNRCTDEQKFVMKVYMLESVL